MIPQTFIIKSIYVQNTIMLFSLGVVLFFLFRALWRKKIKHAAVFSIWVLIVFWFFNSPFFGFSTVCVNTEGIRLNYGVLSSRNTVLPVDSSWKIETYLSGIRKMKKLYFIRIADHQSMKVRGGKLSLLKEIGGAIDKIKHL